MNDYDKKKYRRFIVTATKMLAAEHYDTPVIVLFKPLNDRKSLKTGDFRGAACGMMPEPLEFCGIELPIPPVIIYDPIYMEGLLEAKQYPVIWSSIVHEVAHISGIKDGDPRLEKEMIRIGGIKDLSADVWVNLPEMIMKAFKRKPGTRVIE